MCKKINLLLIPFQQVLVLFSACKIPLCYVRVSTEVYTVTFFNKPLPAHSSRIISVLNLEMFVSDINVLRVFKKLYHTQKLLQSQLRHVLNTTKFIIIR